MNTETKYPFAEIFRERLKKLREKEEIGSLYFMLFDLLSDESLDGEIKYLFSLYKGEDEYFKENGKKDWFYIWHKSIRQTDYFQDLIGYKIENRLTDEQENELKELKTQMEKLKKDVIVEIKINSTEEDYKKHEESYKTLYAMEEHKVLMKKIQDLNKIKRHHEDIHLGGKMDSMLWNIVHLDKKNNLYETFLRTFSELEIQTKMQVLNVEEEG